MKSIITKIALCLMVVIATIACKKEDTNPTTSGNGLTPSASNTQFEQVLNVQINGTNWMATSNIHGNIGTIAGTTATSISGRKTTSSGTRERITVGMVYNPTIGVNYNIKNYMGSCDIEYNSKQYTLVYFSSASDKNHMNLQILNIIQDPIITDIKHIAADFSGVIYNIADATDSISVNGSIRFK